MQLSNYNNMKNYRQQFNWKALLLTVLLAVLPSSVTLQSVAQTYISDVAVAGGKNRENWLKSHGYTVISTDLNKGVSGSWDIYLGYKTTTDPSQAITGLMIWNKWDQKKTVDGCAYTRVPYNAEDEFNGDLNRGCGSNTTDLLLMSTKDHPQENGVITSINVVVYDSGTSDYISYVRRYNGDSNRWGGAADCNESCGSSTPYIYIKVEYDKRPFLKFSFKPNGADVVGSMADYSFIESGTLPKNTFTREGYYFNGWNLQAGGEGTTYADGANVNAKRSGDKELYAMWRRYAAVNKTTNKEYKTMQDAIDDACENDNIMLYWDVTDRVKITKSINLDLNGKTMSKAFIQNTSGTLKISNGTISSGVNGLTSTTDGDYFNKQYAGDVELEKVTVNGTLSADYHHYTITSGTYTAIINNTPEGKVDIVGAETFVKSINNIDKATSYPGITLLGGYYAQDPLKMQNVVVEKEYGTITLGRALNGAPDDTYIYQVARMGEGLISYVKTADSKGNLVSYANTQLEAVENTKVQLRVKLNSIGKGINPIFGSTDAADMTGTAAFAVWVNGNDNSFGFATGGKTFSSPAGIVKDNIDYSITLQKGIIEIDSGDDGKTHVFHHEFPVYPFHTNGKEMYVGKIDGSDTSADLDIHYLKIWEGSEQKSDMTPAYCRQEKATGACFYDKIQQNYVLSANRNSDNNNLFDGSISACTDLSHYGFFNNTNGNRQCLICGYEEAYDAEEDRYIDFNGSSYFDTGYVPSAKTKVRMHFLNQQAGSTGDQYFFGSIDSKSQFAFCDRKDGFSVFVPSASITTNKTKHTPGLSRNQEYYLTMSMKHLAIATDAEYENLFVDTNLKSITPEGEETMLVGATRENAQSGKVGTNLASFKLFSFEIYEDGELKHKYLPDSQFGKYGFRDSVDGTFHAMLGDGATSPMEKKDESYINNNGEFYYETDVLTTNETHYDVRFKINKNTSDGYKNIFGCVFSNNQGPIERQITATFKKDNVGANRLYLISRGKKNGQICQITYDTDFALELGEVYTLKIRRSSDEVHVDVYKGNDTKPAGEYSKEIGDSSKEIGDSGWDVGECSGGNKKLIIFNDQALHNNYIADMTLYKLDIYEGDNLIRRYLPYNGPSNQPCLFDAMTDSIFTPQFRNNYSGTGDFVNIVSCAEHKYSEVKGYVGNELKYECKVCGESFTKTRNYLVLGNSIIDTGILPTVNTNVRMGYKTPDFKSSPDFVHLFGQDNGNGYSVDSYYLELVQKKKCYGWNSDIEGYTIRSNTDEYISFWHDKALIYDSPEMETPIFAFSRKNSDYQGGTPDAKKLELPGIFNKEAQAPSMYMLYFMDIYDKDADGKDICLRKYVPAMNDKYYGLFDIVHQEFVGSTKGAVLGAVMNCDEHEYLDILENDGIWQKHCRVCDNTKVMTPEELGGGAFIRTNGSSAFVSADKKVSLGTIDFKTNTDVKITVCEEGGELKHKYYPSRFKGTIQMYDAVSGDFEQFTGCGMSAYIPECGYHQYYEVVKDEKGNNMKHCYICDAMVPLNTIKVTSKNDLLKVEEEYDTHIIYIDMAKDSKHEQHVGSKYPDVGSSTIIYEYATLQEGALKHYFMPGIFNEKNGLYDVVTDNFIEVPDAQVNISTCNHKYCTKSYIDGNVYKHCYICDFKGPDGYYMDITFDANGAKAGIMGVQRIEGEGKVNANLFKEDLAIFGGWVIQKEGETIGNLVNDEDEVKAEEEMKGDVTFVAQWKDAFSYNGKVFAIEEAKTESIDIVDDGVNGFVAAKDFAGMNFSFTRQLESGEKYGTLCLPFAIEDKYEEFDLYVPESVTGQTIKLQKVSRVDPGEPCIFRIIDDANVDVLEIRHEGNETVPANAGTKQTQTGSLVLNGVYERTNIDVGNQNDATYYAIQDNKFYHVATTLSVRPYHAYITNAVVPQAPQRYILDFDDEDATGIIVVEGGELLDLDGVEYYSLSGVKLKSPQKGVNIVKLKNGVTRKVNF